ncbi:hypothetical protein KKB83_00050 [Patescibacteria group bacterium]|nr:hypothetical protein [Patescibacteria group bacterium]
MTNKGKQTQPTPKEKTSFFSPDDKREIKKKSRFEKPEVLLTWKAPSREFHSKPATYFATLTALTLLVIVLLALGREYTLSLVVLAVAFVLFSLNRYEPSELKYELLNTGLKIEDHEFGWEKFLSFFIEDKNPFCILYLRTTMSMPRVLKILFPQKHNKQIEEAILNYLSYRQFKTSDAAAILDDIVEAFPYDPDAPIPRTVRSLKKRVFKREK